MYHPLLEFVVPKFMTGSLGVIPLKTYAKVNKDNLACVYEEPTF